MSIFTGISGISIGDGAGAHVSLDIKTEVLRIIRTQSLATFMSARAPQSGGYNGAGTIYFRKPQLIQTNAYTVGQISNDAPQVGQIKIDINTQRTANYFIETFDTSRIEQQTEVVGQIAFGLATSIMADQNAHWYMGLMEYFNTIEGKTFMVAMPKLVDPTATTEEVMGLIRTIGFTKTDIEKTFSKTYVGVPGSEIWGIIDGYGLTNMLYSMARSNYSTEALNILMRGAGANDVTAQNIWGINFWVDNFVNVDVPQGQSWAKDYALDTTNFVGFLCHTEFAAMPLDVNTITMVVDPNNANPKWIAKYQFGFGVIRPGLGRAFVKAIPS